MTRGRPSKAIGLWPEMIAAAGGPRALARALHVTDRELRFVTSGLRSFQTIHAAHSRAFARLHGIGLKVYRHPSSKGALLVSSASGWFAVPGEPGGWARAKVARRKPDEDWSSLPALEVDFASTWPSLSPWDV